MRKYMVVFIVDGIRKFEPALEIGERQITYITELGNQAKEELKLEMGEELFRRLWENSAISCIQIYVDAADEKEAIKKAWVNAKQVTNALSLLEFDKECISILHTDSPGLIPNILIANLEEEPISLKIGHYTPPGLMRFNIGELEQKAKYFNETVVRQIGKLMPSVIWTKSEFENELITRLSHSLYWYAIANDQQGLEFQFIAMWFALESLIIESIKTDNKKKKLVNRLIKLYGKHNSEEINQNEIDNLWELRTDIVHEARCGFFEDQVLLTAGHINLVRYFYFLTLLYVLDSMGNDMSIVRTWERLINYKPSVIIEHEIMPEFLVCEGMFRYQQ